MRCLSLRAFTLACAVIALTSHAAMIIGPTDAVTGINDLSFQLTNGQVATGRYLQLCLRSEHRGDDGFLG